MAYIISIPLPSGKSTQANTIMLSKPKAIKAPKSTPVITTTPSRLYQESHTMSTAFKKRKIAHTYTLGGRTSKLSLNAILSAKWDLRKQLHDLMYNCYSQTIMGQPVPTLAPGDQLKVVFGFAPCKSTGNCDLDNFSYLQKIWIDVMSRYWQINDSIKTVVCVESVVLKPMEEEGFYVYVQKYDLTTPDDNTILPVDEKK